MIWTNVFNLPKPIEVFITQDLYDKKRGDQLQAYAKEQKLENYVHFSASDLIKPPRMRVITRRYRDKIVKDISDEIFRVLGQAIHFLLREAAVLGALKDQGYRAEERKFFHFTVDGQVVVISGEPDIVTPDLRIQDYKVVAVWSWLKGAKREWEEQTNIYSFLDRVQGLVTAGLDICFILRDFNLKEKVQEGYPQAGAQMQEVKLWAFEEQRAFIEKRVRLHLAAEAELDEDLPECTSEEMWEKPDAWAVIREGLQRAAKVFTVEHARPKEGEDPKEATAREAHEDMLRRNENPKIVKGKEKPYVVEHRPGERTRCLSYCDARQFCNLYKEYMAATVRTAPNTEKVEEHV